MDARGLVLHVLEAVDDGARSDATLGRCLQASDLGAADKALATRIVYGVLAWRLRLDHTLTTYSKRAIEDLDRPIANVLRVGLYQLCFLDRVPAYAAVDSSVALARRTHGSAAGFVNAVLRRVTRDGPAPIPECSKEERTAIELSHPQWLVGRWNREYGTDDAARLMRANNESAPTILRALIDRDDAIRELATLGIKCEAARFAPQAIRASTAIAVPGVAVPQGEASQLVVCLLAPSAGERVLDACAAPGGKAAYIAASVGSEGLVHAVDPGRIAAGRIASLLELCGVKAEIFEGPVEDLPGGDLYDAVLVDAPCAGLGTLREHPEIRWRRTPEDLTSFSHKQARILSSAARHLRPGGRLVYATCSLSRTENELVVDGFLAAHPSFATDQPSRVSDFLRPLLDDRCALRTFPHLHDMAGFFAQRFVRNA